MEIRKIAAALFLALAFGSASLMAACPTSTTPSANLTNIVNRRVSRLTQLFPTLNATALATYFTTVATNNAAAAPALCTARQTLQTAIEANSADIAADADALSAAQGKLLALNDTAEGAFLATVSGLNSAQLAELTRALGGGGFGRGGFGPFPGHGGFGGPPPNSPAQPQ